MSLKSKLDGNSLDLSLSELIEPPPTKQLLQLKKATEIDFSCNKIRSLPDDFGLLTHITRLDLSQNQLTSLPDSFGKLTNLVYLDLYKNRLTSLPLTLGRLKGLKWLDVKDNPLDVSLQSVAGDCLDAKQCQAAAKNVVQFLQRIASDAERIKQKHLKQERERESIQKQEEEMEKKSKAAEKKKQKELRKLEREQQMLQKRAEELMDGEMDYSDEEEAGQRVGAKKGRASPREATSKRYRETYNNGARKGFFGYVWLLIKLLLLVGLFAAIAMGFMANYCASPQTPTKTPSRFEIPHAWCRNLYEALAHWKPPAWMEQAGNSGLDYASFGIEKAREGIAHVPQMIDTAKVWPYLDSIPRPSALSNQSLADVTDHVKQFSYKVAATVQNIGQNVRRSYPYWLEVGQHYAQMFGSALLDIITALVHYAKVSFAWLVESCVHFWNTLPQQWENAKWLWRNLK